MYCDLPINQLLSTLTRSWYVIVHKLVLLNHIKVSCSNKAIYICCLPAGTHDLFIHSGWCLLNLWLYEHYSTVTNFVTICNQIRH